MKRCFEHKENRSSARAMQYFFLFGLIVPQWFMASSFTRFLDHTQWHTTVGRTPLDEWSACRRDFYLTTHSTHSRQTSMPPVGFEPTISAGEQPQTHALEIFGNSVLKIKCAFWFSLQFSSETFLILQIRRRIIINANRYLCGVHILL